MICIWGLNISSQNETNFFSRSEDKNVKSGNLKVIFSCHNIGRARQITKSQHEPRAEFNNYLTDLFSVWFENFAIGVLRSVLKMIKRFNGYIFKFYAVSTKRSINGEIEKRAGPIFPINLHFLNRNIFWSFLKYSIIDLNYNTVRIFKNFQMIQCNKVISGEHFVFLKSNIYAVLRSFWFNYFWGSLLQNST